MRMDEGLDTGPVYAREVVPITGEATTPVLLDELATRGARLLVEVLGQLERGEAEAVPQQDALATYAPRLSRSDGELSWAMPAVEIDRWVRALTPWPGTRIELGGQRVRLLRGHPDPARAEAPPGTVVASEGESVRVACGEGAYDVLQVQPPGGRSMAAAAYLRGRRPAPAA